MKEHIKWIGVIAITVCLTSLAWIGYGILTAEEPEPDDYCWNCGSWLAGCDYITTKIFSRINGTGTIGPDEAYANFNIIKIDTNETATQCVVYIWR